MAGTPPTGAFGASGASGISDGIELAPGVRVPGDALRVQYSRSSGPGGQHVNKVNTRAEIWVSLPAIGTVIGQRALQRLRELAGASRLTREDELHLAADESRSQESNRQAAMDRLRELIVRARVEPKPRKRTKPSRAAKARRMDAKRRRGEIKARRRGTGEW